MEKVLLVDENATTREVLTTYLRDLFQTKTAAVSQLLVTANDWMPSVIVVSIEKLFPLKHIMQELRAHESMHDVPVVVFLSDANNMTLQSLYDWGIDDYLMRPVDFTQLYWKLKTLIRRTQISIPSKSLQLGQITLHPESHEVKCSQGTIRVSEIQMKLLIAFSQNTDRVMTRDWLQAHVWVGETISHRSIDAQISKLKSLIPDIANHIVSVYGKGYLWKPQIKDTRVG